MKLCQHLEQEMIIFLVGVNREAEICYGVVPEGTIKAKEKLKHVSGWSLVYI